MTSKTPGDALQRELDAYTVAPASEQLRARLLAAIPPAVPRSWGRVLLEAVGGWRLVAPALAMSLVLGVVVQIQGWLGSAAPSSAAQLDVLELALLDGSDWELSDD